MLKINKLNEIIEFSKMLKILYVEDNEESSSQALKLLSNFFDNITLARNGMEGLSEFRKSKYDLILSDINMPKLDGLKMLEKIREVDENICCLIISAHDETLHFTQAIKLGVNGFLLKPIEYELFVETMIKTITSIQVSKVMKEVDERNKRLSILGQMMDSIAHQWKQPLSLIAMVPTNLEAKIANNIEITKEDIHYCNNIIQEQTEHLIDTVNDFRTFFRPSDDKKNTSIKNVLNSVLSLMHVILVKEDITININQVDDIKVNIISTELKHIFINLISNSKDAFNNLKDNRKKNIDIDIRKKDNDVHIIFEDNAGGISPDIVKHIFDLDFTTKSKEDGTGCGLYLIKQILDKYNGEIKIQDIEHGISFIIKIPINDEVLK